MPYESAQGIGFTFSGTEFLLTSLSFSKSVNEIDITSLKNKLGEFRSYRVAPIREGDEMQVEFFGMTFPQMTATGTIVWTIDASGSNAALTAGLPTVALCTSASLTAAAGELLKGNASFRLTQT